MKNRIVVDIGNTRISCGVFLDGKIVDLSHHLLSNTQKAANDIAEDAAAMHIDQIAICSVVPSISRSLIEYLDAHHRKVFQVSGESQTLISGTYDSLGADRIANIAAAQALYLKKDNAIVIDCGTATTLTAVSHDRRFLGGLITLGLGNTFRSLHQSTEQLPDIEASNNGQPPVPLAFDTANAITSGCIYGQVGIIEQWLKVAKHELGSKTTVIATGGYASLIAPLTKAFDHVVPDLTLHGINFIAEAAMVPADQA
jgi:type III pantothenate kinase